MVTPMTDDAQRAEAAQAPEIAQGVARNNFPVLRTDAPQTPAATTPKNSILRHPDATFRASRQLSRETAAAHFTAVAGADVDPELLDAKARTTWAALAYRLVAYERFCESSGRVLFPCSGEQLKAYVRSLMAASMAPATIASYVACVCTVGRLRDMPVDRRLISEHLKAARRRHGPPRRARPTRGRDVADVVALCNPEAVRDVRDALTFVLGFALASRASELVGIDFERPSSVDAGNSGVLQVTSTGLVVRWSSSKSAQEREVELEIADADVPDARLWLERWLAISKVAPGTALLRPLTKWGTIVQARLSAAAISKIIRGRIEQLELARGVPAIQARARAAAYSSHSLRRGFCTTAAEAGIPLNIIRQRSRHSDDTMLAKYVAEAESRRHSGLAGLIPGKGST